MIELSAFGSGKVVIDDHGVTRSGVLRTQSLAWNDIRSYYLTIELTGSAAITGTLLDDIEQFIDGVSGRYHARFGIALVRGEVRIAFDHSFDDVERAIAHVLSRIHLDLMASMRAQLTENGVILAGDLRLGATELVWGEREPLTLDEVESIELFDASPVRLRVMKHGKVLPYGQAATSEIPNVVELLETARTLGYPVRGIAILEALRSAVP